MTYMVGGRVRRLGSFPGREGEGLGLHVEGDGVPRVARIVYLPGADPSALEGLSREVARAVDALHHPHVQAPLGIDEVDGLLALAVEHADGETLAEILNVGGRLPAPVAARIVRDACLAVQFAHEEGDDAGPILHGWLRPTNLLVCRSGVTLVAGFGACMARSAADLVPWQSPEQIVGGPQAATRSSDVHGLGLVLHACLAGENPFERDPDPDVALLSRPAPGLEPLGVPPALAAVVRRALSVKPADRFPDALALARAIEAAVPQVAPPSTVAAWSESLFPAGMGMRVLRQRAVDAAIAASRREVVLPAPARSGPVPLPEPALSTHAIEAPRRAGPWRRFGIPRPIPVPAPARSPAASPAEAPRQADEGRELRSVRVVADDVDVPEFSLAAPPFPHPTRRPDPVESIVIDVEMPDPPPPLRFPAPQRATFPPQATFPQAPLRPTPRSLQAIGREDVRRGTTLGGAASGRMRARD